MRMNDYEYEFMCDSRDKKITARSARSTRTHNGKRGSVKFPSDYLSKKEIKAMSGECIKYASLKKPMTWTEFKELPNDLKKEYIAFIRERFGAPDKYIAEMLGVTGNCLGLYVRDLGLGHGADSGNGKRKWEKEKFYAWRSGAVENENCPPVIEDPVEPESTNDSSSLSDNNVTDSSCEKVRAVPHDGLLQFNCPVDEALNMLAVVLGGKKVKLHVQWKVIEDEED